MKNIGLRKAKLAALPQIRDRLSFLYVENCVVNKMDGAFTVTDATGTVHVPAAALSVLLLGPGTSITHRAMELLGDTGCLAIWMGEHGVRYYAHGNGMTHNATLLTQQAKLVSNSKSRVAVARKMYQMRFPGEDVSHLSMQELRGREGARIRKAYRIASETTGVPWIRRDYDPSDFAGGDPINMALSAAHACLYGLAHSVIVALGCSPGLGFIHTGHDKSFVYDIADLYKAEVTIPLAFEVASQKQEDIGSVTRRRVRDAFADHRLLEKMVHDIHALLMDETNKEEIVEATTLHLWDDKMGIVKNATSYGKDQDNDNNGSEVVE